MSAPQQSTLLPEPETASVLDTHLAPVSDFYEHPAQMRTRYRLDDMATLTLQVVTRGLDRWQPIVAAPRPNDQGYYLISGHRRRMARLFGWALEMWRAHPESGVTADEPLAIEQVRTFLATLLEKYQTLEAAAEALAAKFAERPLAFVRFEGSEKAQILALQGANYGQETPDVLGVARSFKAAVEAGATVDEIARNVGQQVHYVLNHLALTRIPEELAEKVADGTYPMGLARLLADVEHDAQRNALALVILSNAPELVTAKKMKEVITALHKWPGLRTPLVVAHQAQRNLARVLARLWSGMVEAYPLQSWAVLVSLLLQGVSIESPWEEPAAVEAWFRLLGGETYWDALAGKPRWGSIVQHLLTEVSCQTCPLAQLPPTPLASDLSPGRSDVLGMPCRHQVAATRCLHGFAPADPVRVRVPLDWADHVGITHDGPFCIAEDMDVLIAAWQAQQAAEAAEAEIERAEAMARVAAASTDAGAEHTSRAPGTSAGSESAPEADGEYAAPATPARPTPVQRQRQQLRGFMGLHLAMRADHPWATPCHQCQHRLEGSPTKDESVPPCAWAARLREVRFSRLQPEAGGLAVPICHQFAPNARWAELIPEHPAPGTLPREWLHRQIVLLARLAAPRHASGRAPFEFLTGRPMTKTESHGDWFQTQLAAQIGELTDAQLYTLFLWAHEEPQRQSATFSLPASGGQFIPVQEVAWTPALPKEEVADA